jgi:hypothetical protein
VPRLRERLGPRAPGYHVLMKLFRMAAMAGIAKKVYDESRKPENQRRIKEAVASVRERRNRKG